MTRAAFYPTGNDMHTQMKPILVKYESRLIGERKDEESRKTYVRMAERMLDAFSDVKTASEDEILSFRDRVCIKANGKQVEVSTQALYTSTMNHFLAYMQNPVRVKVPKKITKVIKPLLYEEVEAMIRVAGENPNPRLVARDKTIAYLLVESAGRRGEVSSILKEDVNLETGEVIFRDTKNGDDRTVYLPEEAIQAVASYIEGRVQGITPEDDRYLFTTARGRAMGDGTVYRTVKLIAARAGIKRRVYPHLFRHTKLTQLGRMGMNQFDLRAFSGHKTVEALSPYVHPEAEEVKRQVLSNPLVRPQEKSAAPMVIDTEQVIAGLALRLAKGEIDQGTFNRALDSLQVKKPEAPQRCA